MIKSSISCLSKGKRKMEQKTDIKIGLKSFLKTIGLLYAILVIVGILTYIIPAGSYKLDEAGKIIEGSFEFITSTKRLPWYRWPTAPIEGAIFGDGNMNMFQIFAMILLLGGCFKVLEDSGAIKSLIKIIINKFKDKRYLSIWIITLLMMSLSSFFGLQEELLILFPIFFSFAHAMKWSKVTALNFVLITTGVGFTCALFNPFTIGLCAGLSGTTILDGMWFRAIIFVVFYFTTSLYLVRFVKKEEKKAENDLVYSPEEIVIDDEDKKKATMTLSLFAFVLFIVILFSVIPFLRDLGLGMVIMGIAFVIGTLVIGRILIGSFKQWGKSFWKGCVAIAPSLIIMMVAFSIKYVAERADILHTTFYYIHNYLSNTSPFVSVLIIYVFVLLVEFFIPGSSAKALLLIPLLTLAPIPGISKNIIILCYLFGDGYTNVLYPTCGTLLIGLGLADVSFIDWVKKNGLYMIFLILASAVFLLLAVLIGV